MLIAATAQVHGLTLVNAMYMSTWTDNWVDVPFDENQFLALLNQRRNGGKE